MRKKETPNPSRVRGRGVEVSETLFYAHIYVRPQGRSPCGVDFVCRDYLSLSWDFFLCFG